MHRAATEAPLQANGASITKQRSLHWATTEAPLSDNEGLVVWLSHKQVIHSDLFLYNSAMFAVCHAIGGNHGKVNGLFGCQRSF